MSRLISETGLSLVVQEKMTPGFRASTHVQSTAGNRHEITDANAVCRSGRCGCTIRAGNKVCSAGCQERGSEDREKCSGRNGHYEPLRVGPTLAGTTFSWLRRGRCRLGQRPVTRGALEEQAVPHQIFVAKFLGVIASPRLDPLGN